MSQLVSAAEFIRRHLPALRGTPAPAIPKPVSHPQARHIHCAECDGVLPLTSRYLRCQLCRASVCDTPVCQKAHALTHGSPPREPGQTTLPLAAAPVAPLAEGLLPADALFRCAACRRPLARGTYRNCGLCDGHVCRGGRCQNDHFIAHRVAALRAAKSSSPTAPVLSED